MICMVLYMYILEALGDYFGDYFVRENVALTFDVAVRYDVGKFPEKRNHSGPSYSFYTSEAASIVH